MALSITNELEQEGFCFLSKWRPDANTIEVADDFGSMLTPWPGGTVQKLVPRTEASPNTYSGIYGHNSFPFHTDLAHWPVPPRYLLLRCITGYDEIPTLLLDGFDLMESISLDILRRAIFKPRRPQGGTFSLIRLCEPEGDLYRLRWDEVFLKPASRIGDAADQKIRDWLSKCQSRSISLAKRGDTVIIDNWRMLHSRTPIPFGCEDRTIERVYLKDIEC